MTHTLSVKELRKVLSAKGSLLFVKSIPGVSYGEIVEVLLESGESRLGQVIDVSRDVTVIQVFGGVSEVNVKTSKVRFKGESLRIPVSIDMFGRILDGLGRPIDGGPGIVPEDFLDINGMPINPASRLPPSEFIETGISVIDGLLSIVRGQKLPIFSGAGLPHNRIATQIVRQARVRGSEERFAVVFAAIGVTYEDAYYFINTLKKSSSVENVVSIINTASAPTIE
ncbi:MAG: V-type ATP synthase subunit B, partial [Sulfolobales archaeon]